MVAFVVEVLEAVISRVEDAVLDVEVATLDEPMLTPAAVTAPFNEFNWPSRAWRSWERPASVVSSAGELVAVARDELATAGLEVDNVARLRLNGNGTRPRLAKLWVIWRT